MPDIIKVGDIVKLKSGSPEMTVVENNTSRGSVEAVWFVGTKKEAGYFPPATLTHIRGK